MTPAEQLEDAIQILTAWAAGEPSIGRVFIYGSRVRGRSKTGEPIRPDSDLDIAIEPDTAIDQRTLVFMDEGDRWRSELRSLLSWCPHIELYDADTTVVHPGVTEAGHLIYTKAAG